MHNKAEERDTPEGAFTLSVLALIFEHPIANSLDHIYQTKRIAMKYAPKLTHANPQEWNMCLQFV